MLAVNHTNLALGRIGDDDGSVMFDCDIDQVIEVDIFMRFGGIGHLTVEPSIVLAYWCHDPTCAHQLQSGNASNKFRNVAVDRICNNVFRRTDLHKNPIFHNGDAVTYTDCLIQIVCDEKWWSCW